MYQRRASTSSGRKRSFCVSRSSSQRIGTTQKRLKKSNRSIRRKPQKQYYRIQHRRTQRSHSVKSNRRHYFSASKQPVKRHRLSSATNSMIYYRRRRLRRLRRANNSATRKKTVNRSAKKHSALKTKPQKYQKNSRKRSKVAAPRKAKKMDDLQGGKKRKAGQRSRSFFKLQRFQTKQELKDKMAATEDNGVSFETGRCAQFASTSQGNALIATVASNEGCVATTEDSNDSGIPILTAGETELKVANASLNLKAAGISRVDEIVLPVGVNDRVEFGIGIEVLETDV